MLGRFLIWRNFIVMPDKERNGVDQVTDEVVLMEIRDSTMRIILNREEKMNALNVESRRKVASYLSEAQERDDVHTVVLTGKGKNFCAGADVNDLFAIASATNLEERRRLADKDTIMELGLLIRKVDKPVIACVHGYCLGGGFELSQFCDMIFATEDTMFGQPEVNIGIIPGGGGTQNLPRIIGKGRAKEMIFTGRRINATQAMEMGILNGVFPNKEERDKYVEEISALIASKSSLSVALSKKAINATSNMPLEDGLNYERELAKSMFTSKQSRDLMDKFLKKS